MWPSCRAKESRALGVVIAGQGALRLESRIACAKRRDGMGRDVTARAQARMGLMDGHQLLLDHPESPPCVFVCLATGTPCRHQLEGQPKPQRRERRLLDRDPGRGSGEVPVTGS